MSRLSKEEITREAISIVDTERTMWEDADVQITDRVRFNMRDVIRTCRKNYWGVFDKPIDPITKRKKIWYPLTQELIDTIAPKIKVPAKNVNFRARHPKGYGTTEIIRGSIQEYLIDTDFSEDADRLSYDIAIDGTAVMKIWKEGKGKMRETVKRRRVDLLNVYIDPTADSIQSAYRFTERAVLYADEVNSMSGWENRDVVGVEGIAPTDDDRTINTTSTKAVDVYEMWGKIPKYLITGNSEDTEEIDGHIIVSGFDADGPTLHLIEKNTNKDKTGKIIKPYEEAWYVRVPGRWYGRGVAEKVMSLQLYMNIMYNIRTNRSYVSQLGLFKIRKGANITPAELSRLGSNGAVLVNNMDDIEQLVVQEASQASYTDENNTRNIAQRLTSAFEVVTGESLPASTTATNAVLMNRSASSTFSGIIDRTGRFYQRLIDRHVLPHVADDLKCGEMVRLSGDYEEFDKIIDRVAVYLVQTQLDKEYANGKIPTEEQILSETERVKGVLRNRKDLFVNILDEIITDSIDTFVYVTNEDLDISVTIDKMTTVLQMVPEYREIIVPKIFDLMGLPKPELPKTPTMDIGSRPAGSPSMDNAQAMIQSMSNGQRDMKQPRTAITAQ